MATKEKKREIVSELEALFAKSQVAIVADLSGLTVAELTQFRRKLDKDSAQCRIAKNTLIKIASQNGQYSSLSEITKGPSALVLGYDDPAAPAKTTVQYFVAIKKGIIRGGVLEGKLMSMQEVKALAELPSKEQIYASIAGALDSGARNIAAILEGIIRDVAILIEEVAKTKNQVTEPEPKLEPALESGTEPESSPEPAPESATELNN